MHTHCSTAFFFMALMLEQQIFNGATQLEFKKCIQNNTHKLKGGTESRWEKFEYVACHLGGRGHFHAHSFFFPSKASWVC